MYRPEYSQNDNLEIASQLIEEYPLGLMIAAGENPVLSGYLPFIVQQENSKIVLYSHMARANELIKAKDVHVYFQGPDRYISPTIYRNHQNVPTWNYAVVQIIGRTTFFEDKNDLLNILNKSSDFFEKRNKSNWKNNLSEESMNHMFKYIIGFKIEVEQVIPKFKLSQNREDQDYQGVHHFLSTSTADADKEMLKWMNLSGE